MKIPTLFKHQKPPVIADPLRDAEERYHCSFRVKEEIMPWSADGVYRTTEEFRQLDAGYTRHCGPTALTNLLLTLDGRRPVRAGKQLNPAKVFQRVAALGRKKHFYWNTDFLKLYGGTVNMLAGPYLKAAFRQFGIAGAVVKGPYPAWKKQLRNAFSEGALLYLELIYHRSYGNHHVLGYGCRTLAGDDGSERLYVMVADGWSDAPRFLNADDLRAARFLAVTVPGTKRTAS